MAGAGDFPARMDSGRKRVEKEAGIAQMVEALATERAGIGLVRWNALFAALLAEAYRKTEQTSEGLNVVNEELAMRAE